MEAKLEAFLTELQQGQEEAAAKALKHVWHEKPYALRERRAGLVQQQEEAVADVEAELTTAGPAREALQRGVTLLSERQKLIRIVDRSEFGWGVVSEYTADDLVLDSANEKRLEKAEKAAEQKAAKRLKKWRTESPTRWAGKGQPGAGQLTPFLASASAYQVAPTSVAQMSTYQLHRPPATAWPIRPCFACS